MFKITNRQGFHITFPSGYTLSAQFGPNAHTSRNTPGYHSLEDMARFAAEGAPDAECAILDENGMLVDFPDGESMLHCVTPRQFGALVAIMLTPEPAATLRNFALK